MVISRSITTLVSGLAIAGGAALGPGAAIPAAAAIAAAPHRLVADDHSRLAGGLSEHGRNTNRRLHHTTAINHFTINDVGDNVNVSREVQRRQNATSSSASATGGAAAGGGG
jgi:hypothetical protein